MEPRHFWTKNGLNSNQIKLIAIVAMTIDHLIWTIFPGTQKIWYVYLLHVIGRLTAPIMWFFIAEGAFYTHNIRKYFTRLLGFALLSHFAYCFAFGIPFAGVSPGAFNRTSVLWSLALSVLVIAVCRDEKVPKAAKYAAIFAGALLGFPSDWSSIAVMAPLFLYSYRGSLKKQGLAIVGWSLVYGAVYFFFLDKPYGVLQLLTCLCIPVLSQYNGKRGTWRGMKWFFYLYYPAHLAVLGCLRLALHGNISTIF